MATLIRLIKRYRLVAISLIIVLVALKGCEWFPESTFKLANDSRLPKWVTLPPGLARINTSLTMSYYIKPLGRTAQFILRGEREKVLMKENGKMICKQPFHLKYRSQEAPSDYPSYEAISVNGITEIIEHKRMEPIFYVTDDPAVWQQYEAKGC